MILACVCKHAYQDAQYGKGQRVHNPCKYGTSGIAGSGARCTVCGDVKAVQR